MTHPIRPGLLSACRTGLAALWILASWLPAGAQNTAVPWERKPTPIITPWGETVTPQNAWREYPRPTLVRKDWLSLGGLWDFALAQEGEAEPTAWPHEILVPFSVQSALGGVALIPGPDQVLWYQKTFDLPAAWTGQRVLLHFEAVDFASRVFVNGKTAGEHLGSYDAFSFDITALLKPGTNRLVVCAGDQSPFSARSVGKQTRKEASEYEDLTGIWQSVWLEPVSPQASVEDLEWTSDLQTVEVKAQVQTGALPMSAKNMQVTYALKDGDKVLASAAAPVGEAVTLRPQQPQAWSPETPKLYDLEISLQQGGKVLDRVQSYCAFRTIALDRSVRPARIVLNGQPLFQVGPLDQNYWPESGLTPPSDAAMLWEIQYLKNIGCNMVRVHITRKPRRYYWHCDREGLLVWQDMACGRDTQPSAESSAFWQAEQRALVRQLRSHPSIVMWIVFNEAWGQHNTREVFNALSPLDPTRLWSVASGWDDVPGLGQIRDLHDYTFFPAIPPTEERAVVLGECGGFASAVVGNNWLGRSNKTGEVTNPVFGGFNPDVPRDTIEDHDFFRPTFTAGAAFDAQYRRFVEALCMLKASGLSAAVYTQLTDMKREENGYLSFDRRVSKVDPEATARAHRMLYAPAPVPRTLWGFADEEAGPWRAAVLPLEKVKGAKEPDALRLQKGPDFAALSLTPAGAPFRYGFEDAANVPAWDGNHRLVVQREWTLDSLPHQLSLRVASHIPREGKGWVHTRVYVNGVYCMDETTRHEAQELKVAELPFNARALEALRPGTNTLTLEIVPGLDRGQLKTPPPCLWVDFALMAWEQ